MKKILLILIALLAISSCKYEKNCVTTITYRIYYPGNTVTKAYSYDTTDEPCYILHSDRGSNYLKLYEESKFPYRGGRTIEGTSAPIEIVSYNIKKK